jgi:hypothetical protein
MAVVVHQVVVLQRRAPKLFVPRTLWVIPMLETNYSRNSGGRVEIHSVENRKMRTMREEKMMLLVV